MKAIIVVLIFLPYFSFGFLPYRGKHVKCDAVLISRKYYDPFIPVEDNPVFDLDLSPKTARRLRSKINGLRKEVFPASAFKEKVSTLLAEAPAPLVGRADKILRKSATIDDIKALIANTTTIKKALAEKKEQSTAVKDLTRIPNVEHWLRLKQIRENQVKRAIKLVIGKRRARNDANLVDQRQVALIVDLLRYDAYRNFQTKSNATIPHRSVEERLRVIDQYRSVFEKNCTRTRAMSVDTLVSLLDFKTDSALLPYYRALVAAVVRRALAMLRGGGISSPARMKDMDLDEFLFLRFLVEDDVFASTRPLNRNDKLSQHHIVNGKLFGCYSIHDAIRDELLTAQEVNEIVRMVVGKKHQRMKALKIDKQVIMNKKKQKILIELILIAIENNSVYHK